MATLFLVTQPHAGRAQAPGGMGPAGRAIGVGVVTLETAQVPFTKTVLGRAVAYQQVDICPRVGGMIAEIVYDAGRSL